MPIESADFFGLLLLIVLIKFVNAQSVSNFTMGN